MRLSALTLLLTTISLSLFAQTSNCSKFKTGKFKSTYNGHVAEFDRSENYQTEYDLNRKDSLKVVFKVEWVDDCTYTLAPTSQTLAKFPKIPKNTLITVKMSNVTDTSYTQTSTSNLVNKTIVSEVTKIR